MDRQLPVALGIVVAAAAVVLVAGPSSAVRRPAEPYEPRPSAGCSVPLPTDGRPVSPVHRNGVSGR
jgi:hypothetical protein